MDRKRPRPPPPSPPPPVASSASSSSSSSSSSVLDDGDLLREILLRLAHPTFLVRAALVCRRWLRHASDRAFLRRFAALYPPRLLGFYVDSASLPRPRFVPLPHPPELAAVVRRGSFDLGTADLHFHLGTGIYCCRNGRLLVCHRGGGESTLQLRRPLHPASDGAVISTFRTPPRPLPPNQRHTRYILLPEDGGDGDAVACTVVTLVSSEREVFAKVEKILQAGVWDVAQTSAPIELPAHWRRSLSRGFLVNGKLYMLGTTGYILGLELVSMSLFFIEVPDAVRDDCPESFQLSVKLSQAEKSGLYLIHVEGFKIHVWLHGTDGNSTGDWNLVNTICLREVFGHLVKPSWESGDSRISLPGSGDNAEFVFLEVDGEVFCMDIISRTVEKVYEMAMKDDFLFEIYPFMMVWPPIFPALIKTHDPDIRVSNELGSGRPRAAMFNVIVAVVESLMIGLLCMAVVLAVAKIAGLLGLTMVLNSVQPVVSGTLKSV
uniref:F-box domain-containing protein n=1 Tax=Oryza meridionalis TaxID=40149 RepID=A0A0E0CJE2_9ORYZ